MSTASKIVRLLPSAANDGASIGPLPFSLTPLIGREALVASVVDRLSSPAIRLLTLIGPGGIGKSRLALEAAHAVRASYEDGTQLIRLASVTDPDLVPVILARALGVWSSTNREDRWAFARERHSLLLVDNFEQLLPAAPAVVDVLSNCPHVKMLITSRVPLHVSGEHEFPVPPLSIPSDESPNDLGSLRDCDAVQLFVERALAVNPDFQLSNANAGAVARITRQLDGLPLAIELAAAQSKHLSTSSIVDRLTGVDDVLRGGPIDRPPHQRAIRETIAWSYDLLDPWEQQAFRRMSTFAGGFLPSAAAYVCDSGNDPPVIHGPDGEHRHLSPILDTCISLSDKNLIFKTGDLQDEPRFAMLLTIRGFAHAELHRLGEWEAVGQRHAVWYLTFAKIAAVAIRGPSQRAWLDWLQIEHPNLRTALEWFREHDDIASFAAMANALSRFWLVRGHVVEGSRWMQLAIAEECAGEIEPALRTDLLCAAGWLALRQGLPEVGRRYAEESLAAARLGGNPVQIGDALRLLGDIEDRLTNYARAGELLGSALVAYREAGNQAGIADALTGVAGIALDAGDYEKAEQLFRQAIDAATTTGDAIMLARVIDALSVTLHVKGDSAGALKCAEHALELYRTHGDVRGIAVATDHVGKCSRSLGDMTRAWSCHRDSLAWRRKFGDPRGIAVWLEAIAALLECCDAFDSAACVLGASDSLRKRGGFPIHNHERAQLQPTLRRTGDGLSPQRFSRQWTRGSRLTLTEAIDSAYRDAEQAVAEALQKAPANPVDYLSRFGLTPRETEVLRLIGERLTDKEIAAQLAISPRTASTHVTMILGKLGVHSRRDAARLAAETAL